MGKKKSSYVIESQFDDLHGNAEDAADLELDLSDSDNPVIKAALGGEDDDWTPPEDDDQDDEEDEANEDDADDDLEDDEEDDSVEDSDDDEIEDDEDAPDEDNEDDDSKYSRKVRKRIDRERDARRRDNDESNRRIAKLEKGIELRDARDDFAREEREANTKLAKLRKKKIAAVDDGETTEVVDIDDEILDIKAEIKAKSYTLKQREESIDDDSVDTSSVTPVEGQKFLDKYPQFHSSKSFRDVVLLTDKSVAARGFDKNTKEYYEEIENILRSQFPKIIKKKANVTVKRKKKRSAVGSTTKPGTRRSKTRSRRGVVRLTKTDQDNMVIFGMDPKNPADAKAWAESKGK